MLDDLDDEQVSLKFKAFACYDIGSTYLSLYGMDKNETFLERADSLINDMDKYYARVHDKNSLKEVMPERIMLSGAL